MQGEVGVDNIDEATDGEERKKVFEGDTVVVCTGDEGEVILKRLKRFPGHCQYRSSLELCCMGGLEEDIVAEKVAVGGCRSSRLPTRFGVPPQDE